MYKIRVILDTQEDVIRTILVNETKNLEHLHNVIANAFGFDGNEMASFYKADDKWNQGEEIPLFNMAEAGEAISMATCILQEIVSTQNNKLIYVYDFLQMWTFYVEVIEISNEQITDSKIILSVGNIPEEAPQKEFQATDISSDFDNEFNDEFDDFERLDNFDFDNY